MLLVLWFRCLLLLSRVLLRFALVDGGVDGRVTFSFIDGVSWLRPVERRHGPFANLLARFLNSGLELRGTQLLRLLTQISQARLFIEHDIII